MSECVCEECFETHLVACALLRRLLLCGIGDATVQGSHEISKAVRPRPGRVVFFTGGVLHSARPPLPDVVEPRYSIALKFWLRPLEMQEAGASAAFGEKRRQASTDRDDL